MSSAPRLPLPSVCSFPLFYATSAFFLKGCILCSQRAGGIFDLDYLLIPLHLGVHWACGVVNFKLKRFEYVTALPVRTFHRAPAVAVGWLNRSFVMMRWSSDAAIVSRRIKRERASGKQILGVYLHPIIPRLLPLDLIEPDCTLCVPVPPSLNADFTTR